MPPADQIHALLSKNFIVSKGQKKSQHGQGMLEVLSDSLGLVSNLCPEKLNVSEKGDW